MDLSTPGAALGIHGGLRSANLAFIKTFGCPVRMFCFSDVGVTIKTGLLPTGGKLDSVAAVLLRSLANDRAFFKRACRDNILQNLG